MKTPQADHPPLPTPAPPRIPPLPATRSDNSAEEDPTGHGLLWALLFSSETAAWFTSAAAHAAIAVVLSLLVLSRPGYGPSELLFGSAAPADEELLDLELGPPLDGAQESAAEAEVLTAAPAELTVDASVAVQSPVNPFSPAVTVAVPPQSIGNGELGDAAFASASSGFEGRSADNRRALALAGGGTDETEAAVEEGLAWLAAHQYPDGSWRFDLEPCPSCQGQCRNSGVARTDCASTGLALLCFLGAGYTHQDGPYQETVQGGLYFLTQQMRLTRRGGDLRGRSGEPLFKGRDFVEKDGLISILRGGVEIVSPAGDMYTQGIATLALCEAYGMTQDPELAGPARSAAEFIINAQYPSGGWRYKPKWELLREGVPEKDQFLQGDTTITGWQVTALKSALLAGIDVPRSLWYRVADFLDTVQSDGGSVYGYTKPDKNKRKKRTTTAIGLFCRMMLGWPIEHRPLQKGLGRLADETPGGNHMYYNYYASQVLHHAGGRGWERWNQRNRTYLVRSQGRRGHERGSWFFDEEWTDYGGRLYSTTMAILTLEVYYRYLPMYGDAFIGEAP
ncbi:MAG: prenyltransferase/squalene oxidase repeat-containing protein [Planctomycetota bacterium]